MIKESNVTINVSDLKKSIEFYESIGFTIRNRWGDYYAQLTAPGITIGLHPSKESGTKAGSGNVSLGFTADNLEETRVALGERNIDVTERNEEGGQFIHFKDPDGILLYFIKPKW